ncbi:hypothetical protein FACHB389_23725 [Nostoc calcicola FACHB-389]|nr:hypothetical protein FACHB389_23725 [Nostoc calcicola FACHB-389]
MKSEVGSRKSEVLNQATHKGWGFYLPSDTRTVSPTRGEVLNLHFMDKDAANKDAINRVST